MPYKNTSITVSILDWDVLNGVGKTGDASNITIRAVGDGSEFTPAAPNVTEVDSTNLPGVYSVTLSASENNYSVVSVGGKTTSTGCSIRLFQWSNETTVLVQKNVGINNFTFMMADSTGNPKTGLTVTAQRSIDGAAFGACANAVSEISNGFYKINLAAADLNGAVIALRFSATGAADRDLTIITQP